MIYQQVKYSCPTEAHNSQIQFILPKTYTAHLEHVPLFLFVGHQILLLQWLGGDIPAHDQDTKLRVLKFWPNLKYKRAITDSGFQKMEKKVKFVCRGISYANLFLCPIQTKLAIDLEAALNFPLAPVCLPLSNCDGTNQKNSEIKTLSGCHVGFDYR